SSGYTAWARKTLADTGDPSVGPDTRAMAESVWPATSGQPGWGNPMFDNHMGKEKSGDRVYP
ncbi:MAG: hypothetical protein M3332_02550, partial [Actinomycetota bacterium]|nr:hypothetical protein [Actinomycetota bacterium]